MRIMALLLILLACPGIAYAVDKPMVQASIVQGQVLRGHFTDFNQMQGVDKPFQSAGTFVLAPGQGLLWMIEKPMATTTIVTPDRAAQDIGGLVLKLAIKNLHHIYDMVGGALTGDWHALETDYAITRGGDARHWQMLLTARPDSTSKLPYRTITVAGTRFIDSIALTKADGSTDILNFMDAALSAAPLSPTETAMFAEVQSR